MISTARRLPPWFPTAPDHWEVRPIKTLFRREKTLNTARNEPQILSLTLRGVVENDPDAPEGLVPEDYGTYQVFEANDLVLKLIDLENVRTSRVGFVPKRGIMSSAYLRLRPLPGTNSRFAYWQLFDLYNRRVFNDLGSGVRSTLGADDVLALPFLTPPASTQVAIADFLDAETARIDTLRLVFQRLHQVTQERAEQAIAGFVLNLQDDSRSDPCDVPMDTEISDGWSVVSLGSLLDRITYGFTNPMPTTQDGPALLTANDIADGQVQYETARRTSQEAFENLLTDKSRPRRGDILLTKDGSLGRVAVHNGTPACINQSVAVLRPKRDISGDLLAELLRARPYREALIHDAGGTTIKHLYITRVAKLKLAVPPIAEQESVLRTIAAVRAQSEQLASALAHQVVLLEERRQALITAAVTGDLEIPGVAA